MLGPFKSQTQETWATAIQSFALSLLTDALVTSSFQCVLAFMSQTFLNQSWGIGSDRTPGPQWPQVVYVSCLDLLEPQILRGWDEDDREVPERLLRGRIQSGQTSTTKAIVPTKRVGEMAVSHPIFRVCDPGFPTWVRISLLVTSCLHTSDRSGRT